MLVLSNLPLLLRLPFCSSTTVGVSLRPSHWAVSSALPCLLNRAAAGGQLVTSSACIIEIMRGNDWTVKGAVYVVRSHRRRCILGNCACRWPDPPPRRITCLSDNALTCTKILSFVWETAIIVATFRECLARGDIWTSHTTIAAHVRVKRVEYGAAATSLNDGSWRLVAIWPYAEWTTSTDCKISQLTARIHQQASRRQASPLLSRDRDVPLVDTLIPLSTTV